MAERRRTNTDVLGHAIEDHTHASGDAHLRNWARQDPSFAVFRDPKTDYQLRKDYKEIIGDPPPSQLLDLAPFPATQRSCAPTASTMSSG
jgi:hypothetical protein